jgi:hypothetical protein
MNNKKYILLIMTFFFLLFTLSVCGQKITKNVSLNETKKELAGWKTFRGTNYSIQYPTNWELNQSGQMGSSFILFSPLDSDNDKFKENLNLLVQDLTGLNIDLDKFVEISEVQVKTIVTNSKLIESKRMRNTTPEFHKMVYTGDQGIFQLKFEQYFWVINQQAYILTLTCEQNKFSNYKEIGEKILKSLSFKK